MRCALEDASEPSVQALREAGWAPPLLGPARLSPESAGGQSCFHGAPDSLFKPKAWDLDRQLCFLVRIASDGVSTNLRSLLALLGVM